MGRVALAIWIAICGLVVVGVTSSYWFVPRDLPVEPQEGNHSADRVTDILREVCQHEYAVVFVQLNWALLHREVDVFQDFARAYRSSGIRPRVNFHMIDFTPVTDGYAPLAALSGWDEHDPGPNSHQINGVGEVIWLNHGRIVGIARLDNVRTKEELISLTRSYFRRTVPAKPEGLEWTLTNGRSRMDKQSSPARDR